jgi:hypothetical protein
MFARLAVFGLSCAWVGFWPTLLLTACRVVANSVDEELAEKKEPETLPS